MWFGLKLMSTGKDYKIISLINGNLQNCEKQTKKNPKSPIVSSLEHLSKSSLKSLKLLHLLLFSNVGCVRNEELSFYL